MPVASLTPLIGLPFAHEALGSLNHQMEEAESDWMGIFITIESGAQCQDLVKRASRFLAADETADIIAEALTIQHHAVSQVSLPAPLSLRSSLI